MEETTMTPLTQTKIYTAHLNLTAFNDTEKEIDWIAQEILEHFPPDIGITFCLHYREAFTTREERTLPQYLGAVLAKEGIYHLHVYHALPYTEERGGGNA